MVDRVRPTMCKSCPYRPESPINRHPEYKEAVRIMFGNVLSDPNLCHAEQLTHYDPSEPDPVDAIALDSSRESTWKCRGHRNQALSIMHRLGYISAPTDAAYDRANDIYQATKQQQEETTA